MGTERTDDQAEKAAGPDPIGSVIGVASDIGSFIRERRLAAEVSVRQLAERAGVSNPYLSQIERGLRKPSAEVLAQIAGALRVSAETIYVAAGILEARVPSAVRDAIAADNSITERHKQVLLEIYRTFQAELQRGDGESAASGEPEAAIEPEAVIEPETAIETETVIEPETAQSVHRNQ